jgi:hypothetical protein
VIYLLSIWIRLYLTLFSLQGNSLCPQNPYLLTDLVSKEYITKEEYHNVEDTFWHLTEKGKNRIEVYYHYVTIKPEILNHFKPNPENQLRAIKQLSQNMTNLRYRNYTFSYEACLVYQLNNP